MVITFGIRHTPQGCEVWKQSPKHRQSKRFRNTCYCHSLTKAKAWVREHKAMYQEMAEVEGCPPATFVIPDELS